MTTRNSGLHQYTPTLSVIDPRGLAVRCIACHRRAVEQPITERVQRQGFNAKGLLLAQDAVFGDGQLSAHAWFDSDSA